jgi:hypothetical protein
MSLEPARLKLSVIVAASNDCVALAKTLASLKGQAENADTEVIAFCNFDGEVKSNVVKEFPFVKCETLASDTTVPELRSRGIYLSRGKIIALVEDYCVLDDLWCAEVKKVHEAGHAIVGGAVENRCPDKLLNWAVYFYDYGKYMLPERERLAATLSGMNVSYDREVLKKVEGTFRDGFYETSIHEELKGHGYDLYLAPSAIAYLSKDYEFGKILPTYFHLGRSFASQRIDGIRPARRVLLALGSFALPILLLARIAFRTVLKRRYLQKLFLASPALCLLVTFWSAGELCGYLCGEGSSARKWT